MIIKLDNDEVCEIIERHVRVMLGFPGALIKMDISSDSYCGLAATVRIDGATEKPEEE